MILRECEVILKLINSEAPQRQKTVCHSWVLSWFMEENLVSELGLDDTYLFIFLNLFPCECKGKATHYTYLSYYPTHIT